MRHRVAVARARSDALRDCLVSQGWSVSPELVGPEGFADPEPPGDGEEVVVRWYLDQVKEAGGPDAGGSGESAPEVPSELEIPEFFEDYQRCLDAAVEEVPDPVWMASQWLDTEMADLYERVAADPRLVEAVAAEHRCVEAAGFVDADDASSSIQQQAEETYLAFQEGRMERDRAIAELERLVVEEEQLAAATEPCIEERLKVERFIVAEHEVAWLAANGERLAVYVAGLEDDAAELAEYLRIEEP